MDELAVARAVATPIGLSGGRFYFAPSTVARAQQLGLDPLHLYYLGRGGVLGDATAAVVASAFGFINPDLVERMWAIGRQVLTPPQAATEYFECSAAVGRLHFGGLDLDNFCRLAEGIVARTNPAGMPLFAGIAALPRVADPPGRAMQLLTVLRELRGAAHLICLLALGIEPRVAHYVRRPDYLAAFGWAEADIAMPASSIHTHLDKAEAWTDRLVAPAFGGVPPQERAAFVSTVETLYQLLGAAAPVHRPDPADLEA